ncbi:amidohydrolase [Aureococcus anophagefferens]|nr:amidohydrolase [Aureococcus anophagefferens]
MAAQAQKFPADIVDCHHHFLEPQNNAFQGFLKSLGAPNYTCEQYASDCGALPISKTVHVEAMPDDGVAEAATTASGPSRSLVKETVDLFGPDRCMFASNWHINGAVSNSDGADSCEVTMPELYATFQAWVDDWGLDAAAQRALFAGTAAKFYRL